MVQKLRGGLKKLAIVRPSVIATTFSERSVKFLKQQRLNLFAAGLYVLQALLVLIFAKGVSQPVMLHYWANDPLQSAAQHRTVLTSATHHWFDVRLSVLLAAALLVPAMCHLAFGAIARERYEQSLGKKLNDLRWLAGGIIGGLQAVTVAMVFGVNDVALLVAILASGLGIALGLMAIEANQRFWPWSLFAGISVTVTMLTGLCYGLGGILYGAALPAYAYVATALLTLGLIATVANLVLQVREHRQWADYVFAEMVYAGIGFVVISAVTWTIFFGVLR
jgi:hypothetical protein